MSKENRRQRDANSTTMMLIGRPNQTKTNQTKPNQTKSNQIKPNQIKTKSNQAKQNQTNQTMQTKPHQQNQTTPKSRIIHGCLYGVLNPVVKKLPKTINSAYQNKAQNHF
jgi:hypothetical protein